MKEDDVFSLVVSVTDHMKNMFFFMVSVHVNSTKATGIPFIYK